MPQLEHILSTSAVGTASNIGSKMALVTRESSVETHTFSTAQLVVPSMHHVVIFFIYIFCMLSVKAVGNRTSSF